MEISTVCYFQYVSSTTPLKHNGDGSGKDSCKINILPLFLLFLRPASVSFRVIILKPHIAKYDIFKMLLLQCPYEWCGNYRQLRYSNFS